MKEHTLGPWAALAESGDDDGASVWFIYGEPWCSPADVAEDHCTHDPCYDGYVCEVASDELDSEAIRANASLISAAPDLLMAARNLVEHLADMHHGCEDEEADCLACLAFEGSGVMAAIAKAEGRTAEASK